jgi:hypothetical protein
VAAGAATTATLAVPSLHSELSAVDPHAMT